ncbi:MAG: RCC1 domain-containing protein [Syntrophobacteraceae bacterium]
MRATDRKRGKVVKSTGVGFALCVLFVVAWLGMFQLDWAEAATQAKVSAGEQHTVLIKSDGTLWAWGGNTYGQLGDGTTTNHSSPEQIGMSNGWASVAASGFHTAALGSDGTLWTWGDNTYGQLGDGTTTNHPSPEQIGTSNDWMSVAAGGYHMVAIKSNGTLWAWGENNAGQLGDGTTTGQGSPEQIGAANNWGSVSAGFRHTMAIKTDGTMWAWGDNTHGELGDGSTTMQTSPEQIGTDNHWMSVAAGYDYTVAVKSDGTLWAWGSNSSGEMGAGMMTADILGPQQIGTDNHWASVAAGWTHVVGVKSDGTLWSWGNNSYGQMGDGTMINRNSPEQIGTEQNWMWAAAGDGFTTALNSNDDMMAWGNNQYGQVGNNSTSDQDSPEMIMAGLWHSATDYANGWKMMNWFGYFNTNNAPWIYHQTLGWMYPFATSTDSMWLWVSALNGFMWTSQSVYPYMYSINDGAWLYYAEGTSNPPKLYNFKTGKWQSN